MWTIPNIVLLSLFAASIAYLGYKARPGTALRLRTAAASGSGAKLPDAGHPKAGAHE